MHKYLPILAIVILSLTLGIPLVAVGHITGESFEVLTDEYLVDIGYSSEVITVGKIVTFDFSLYTPEKQEQIPFSDVWASLQQDEELYFSGGIAKPRIGPSVFSLTFANPGTTTLSVRYNDGVKGIVATSVNFYVSPAEESYRGESATLYQPSIAYVIGILVLLLVLILGRKIYLCGRF